MKDPSITTPGSSRRCHISTSMSQTKRTVRTPAEMPKGIILAKSTLATTRRSVFDMSGLPRYPKTTESLLYIDERCEDTDQHAASGEHDDYPEIKLLVGPVITLAYDDALARYAAPHTGGVRRSQFECSMGLLDRRGRWDYKGEVSPEEERLEV